MFEQTINDAPTIAGGSTGTMLANRYRVVRPLGSGGMGSVWLVEDVKLDNTLFAVKMLPAILVSNRRAYEQVKREALIALKLVHPNIVQFRALEEAAQGGNPFLVMDYVDGRTLDDYLAEKGQLTEDETLRVLRPIAAALDYAHGKGVVHRDVKPGNVMIAKDGTPYILDFGIAREIQETMTRVTGKLSSGTLMYMSPEQLRGQSPKPAQDIYSFAAMVYECLKGEPPFVRGQIEFQILNEQPESPPGGTQLVASVMSGLAKKPEDRPASCAAVLEGDGFSRVEHVERVEDGRAGASRPPSRVPRDHFDNLPTLKSVKSIHQKVQLWEGGPYWATTNIGAEKPWESGYHFWWGDTVGYKRQGDAWVASDGSKSNFSFEEKNAPTYGKSIAELQSEGWITRDGVLSSVHDAAHVHWGGGWRMPTDAEFSALIDNCTTKWITINGVSGRLVTGKGSYADRSIFLPAAGYGNYSYLDGPGSYGGYWSSTPGSGNSYSAWDLDFGSGNFRRGSNCRYGGRSVRPVRGFAE